VSEHLLATAYGEARLVVHPAHPVGAPSVTLLLSHGAGGGIDALDLQALATRLPERGHTVVLLEQPWRRAGRKIATAPPTLDAALVAAAAALKDLALSPDGAPLVVGGRSAGARSAARSAAGLGAVGCLALSFPLHPPGRPERSRLAELEGSGVPTLVVQGERDPMGRPEEFPTDDLPHVDLAVVPAADHGLRTARSSGVSADDVAAVVVESALAWLERRRGE
jgi:predicted alpha/beta-hydrolase family hydrolase